MVARGCGESRVAGGLYVEIATSPWGLPIEHFLTDPPHNIDAKAMGLTARGMKLVERPGDSGVADLWDIVGEEYYPNPTDIVEEIRRIGGSRRIAASTATAWGRLTPESKLVLLHPRAYVVNFPEVYAAWRDEAGQRRRWHCPTGKHRQDGTADTPDECCVGLWWDGVVGLEPHGDTGDPRYGVRYIPAGRYVAREPFRETPQETTLGTVAVLPIAGLTAVRDPHGGTHEPAMGLARQSRLPVTLADE